MTETNDPRLDAVTEALRSLPLEQRVPGYGHDMLPSKADWLELIDRTADDLSWTCTCDCGCLASGRPDDDGSPGLCDPCRMNIHRED